MARAASGTSASSLSEAVRRLEARLGVRLLNRTTRSVAPTEAGARLLERLGPALSEVEAALDVVNRLPRPAGRHAPAERAGQRRAAGPARHRAALPRRLSRYPAGGDRRGRLRRCPGGRLRRRHPLRRAAGAGHDRGSDRPAQTALRDRGVAGLSRSARPPGPSARPAGARLPARSLRERRDDQPGNSSATARSCGWIRPVRCIVRAGAATDLAVDAAFAGTGIIHLFEDWLRPYLEAAPCFRFWNPGGKPSQGRFFITQGAATCPRRSAPSSISSPRIVRRFVFRHRQKTDGQALAPSPYRSSSLPCSYAAS